MAQLNVCLKVTVPVWLRLFLRFHLFMLWTASFVVEIDIEHHGEMLAAFLARHIKLTFVDVAVPQ
ncbi:MAG: hypothetical protein AB7F35_00670 [Acetobacteraceae bacterium]